MSLTPELDGQVVVVLGGSSGIGLETARLAGAHGADVVITGRNPERLKQAEQLISPVATAAFDVTDHAALATFFTKLERPVDHVMISAGAPYYAPLSDINLDDADKTFHEHIGVMIDVAQLAGPMIRSGGSIIVMSGTGPRRPTPGLLVTGATATGLSTAAATLTLELAPVRVNVIAAGFVDTPLSAKLTGDGLDDRRRQLEANLPIRRVVQPADVAALAVHLMTNTAVAGANFDIDGGRQFVAGL